VRPLGWALFIAYLVVLIIKHSVGNRLHNLSFLTLGLAGFIFIFGSLMKISSGYFIYTSETGPINILMSANDKAYGGFYPNITEKGGPGYIEGGEKLNFRQKQDIFKYRALTWIKEHPFKWISFIPNRIILLFRWDDIAVSRLISPDFNFQKFVKLIRHDPSVTQNYPVGFLSFWVLLIIYHHLFYYAGLIFFIYGFIKFHKDILKNPHLVMLLIYAVIGFIMIMVADSDIRFRYPFMFIIFICNSFFLSELLLPIKSKRGRAEDPPVQN
jgi:hypothetical protein